MTTGTNYHSDEELIKRLQIVLRDASDTPLERSRAEDNQREVRNIAAELAGRIYAEPDKWGIATLPEGLRDDAAADALMAMLVEVPEFRARQPISEWYAKTAESAFRKLWVTAERQAAERGRKEPPAEPIDTLEASDEETTAFFEESGGTWQEFEKQFPRDAFALRLRYMLKRSPEEMAVMLDAANTRAITMRLNRAKDRFRTFCEQSGYSRSDTEELMVRFSEESDS